MYNKRADSNFVLTLRRQDAGLTDGVKVTFQGLDLLSIRQHLGLEILHQSLKIPAKMHFGNQFFPHLQTLWPVLYIIQEYSSFNLLIHSTFHSFVITYSSKSSVCSKNCLPPPHLFSPHLPCHRENIQWGLFKQYSYISLLTQ